MRGHLSERVDGGGLETSGGGLGISALAEVFQTDMANGSWFLMACYFKVSWS